MKDQGKHIKWYYCIPNNCTGRMN